MSMRIERLAPNEWDRLRSIRLCSLLESPESFDTTHEQASLLPPEAWGRQLEDLPTFVAVLDGGDAGIVRGAQDEDGKDRAWLISLWVGPEARGLSIGEGLIMKVIDWARSTGTPALVLDVGEGNKHARALYARMGFLPNGAVPSDCCCEIQLELVLK